MRNARIGVLPGDSLRIRSIGMALASLMFFMLTDVLTGLQVLDERSNRAFAMRLKIVLVVMAGGTLATGLASVVKSRERYVLLFPAVALGLYILFAAIVS